MCSHEIFINIYFININTTVWIILLLSEIINIIRTTDHWNNITYTYIYSFTAKNCGKVTIQSYEIKRQVRRFQSGKPAYECLLPEYNFVFRSFSLFLANYVSFL